MNILKFGGSSLASHKSWLLVFNVIKNSRYPVVIVSACGKTTKNLINAAVLASRGQLPEAKLISEQIRNYHTELTDRFISSHSEINSATGQIKSDCKETINRMISKLNGYLEELTESKVLTLKSRDRIAAIGEEMSSLLISRCGCLFSLNTTFINAREVMKTDSDFGSATPYLKKVEKESARIRVIVEDGQIPVIGGYYGEDKNGDTTTLGFEGSDYTASLLGYALNAKSVTIWSDVNGIYTCDPDVVHSAELIPEISYTEATEMACLGAHILHPATLTPVRMKQIPVYVKNLFNRDAPGTCIYQNDSSHINIRAVTFRKNSAVITTSSSDNRPGYSFLSDIFKLLERLHLKADLVNTTEHSVLISIQNQPKIEELVKSLSAIGDTEIRNNLALISTIGCSFDSFASLKNSIFETITSHHPELISYSSNNKQLRLVIPEEYLTDTICRVHDFLFEEPVND